MKISENIQVQGGHDSSMIYGNYPIQVDYFNQLLQSYKQTQVGSTWYNQYVLLAA